MCVGEEARVFERERERRVPLQRQTTLQVGNKEEEAMVFETRK